ncbi:hypothetical protein FOA52_006749 [Chlamydomonas sp. UWO 241]|nr:hypothetical protein FOA52_006749 [Chlamydomonas sp. UWO 241]
MPVVPEILAKKRRRDDQWAAERATQALQASKKKADKKASLFKRAESFVKEYRQEENDAIRLKRVAKKQGGFHIEPEAKLLFVVRIKGINKVHPKTKKILALLRLRQINNGVFLKVNKASLGLLKYVEPFISYGYPSLKSVKELIYKRGNAKVDGTRVPLTDNKLIEEHLGKHNIICMEDLVHEIYAVGPAFKHVTNFLWPFKLSTAAGGLVSKGKHYVEGGQAGNRQEQINAMISKMN